MARKKKHKTKASVAKYVEKISSEIFNRYQKEITNMIKEYLESSKKLLPILKKRVKDEIVGEFGRSFRLMPFDEMKSSEKPLSILKERIKKEIRQDFARSFRLVPFGGTKRGRKARVKGKRKKVKK